MRELKVTRSVENTMPYGVNKYARQTGRVGQPPSAAAVSNYAAARARMDSYMRNVGFALDTVGGGANVLERAVCMRLAAKFYGIQRRAHPDTVLQAFVKPVALAVMRGMPPARALFVAEASRRVFGANTTGDERAALEAMVGEYLNAAKAKEDSRVSETVTSDPAERVEETGIVAKAEAPPDPLAKLKPRELSALVKELRAQARTLLSEKLGEEAEVPLEALLARAGPKRRRRKGATSGLSFERVTSPDAFEKEKRRRAEEQLRSALSLLDPVAKNCVALRLSKLWRYDVIADELEITRADVEDILGRVRPWLARLTTYFDADWWWQDQLASQT